MDWFHLKGRGDIACVLNDQDFDNDGSFHMVGEKVLIDGHVYTVKGVETWCILHIGKGQPIGLLLAEPREVRTESEKMADVIVTNPEYPPGDMHRYGVVANDP